MDEILNKTIDKILRLCDENEEFNKELRGRLKVGLPKNPNTIEDNKLMQIYEYCIEKVVRRQAEEFYANFPFQSLVNQLVDDFCKMEFFRRKDNFQDFCLALYQQLEGITNHLCAKKELLTITSRMWEVPAYVKSGNGIEPSIDNRSESDYSIAKLIFPGHNRQTGRDNYIEKSMVSLQGQYANDKMRIIVYFLGFKASMKNTDYNEFTEITSLLSKIYQFRNLNHRGNKLQPWEEEIINEILPNKSAFYFRFLGALAQYVKYVKDGWTSIEEITRYALSIEPVRIKLPGPKVVGNIDPSLIDNKKRIK